MPHDDAPRRRAGLLVADLSPQAVALGGPRVDPSAGRRATGIE